MKKVLLVLAMVALTFSMNAQVTPRVAQLIVDGVNEAVDSAPKEWSKGFPYGNIAEIAGKRIKGGEMPLSLQKYGFAGLYKSKSMKSSQRWKENDSYNTRYESVSGKIFTIISVEPYVNIIGSNKYKVELLSKTNETVWLDYSPKYAHSFNFLIEGGFEVSDSYYCGLIQDSIYDEFEEHTTIRSDKVFYRLIRVGNSESSVYYLSANVTSNSTVAIGAEGFQLILKDGTRLSWPEADFDTKVNPSKYGKDYIVSTFIRLTNDQLNKLSTSNPKKAKFYVIINEYNSEYDYTRAFRCVIDTIID